MNKDLQVKALQDVTGLSSSATEDLLLAFYRAELNSTSSDLCQLENDWFARMTTQTGTTPDLRYSYLKNLGYSGTAQDMLYSALVDGSLYFNPRSLFLDGTQGCFFDPSDLSTIFQDASGTIPGAVGSPVGKLLDKSGRGNHASQSTSSAKPILRQDAGGRYYLEFDGVDDYLLTGFLTTQPNTLAVAFNNPASGATIEIVAGARSATADRFFIGAMTDQLQIGYGTPGAQGTAVSSIATHVTVLEGSATLVNGYVDSIVKVSLGASGTATAGCGLVLGALNNAGAINFYSSSRVYGVLALNKILPTSDRQKLERYMARKSGVAL